MKTKGVLFLAGLLVPGHLVWAELDSLTAVEAVQEAREVLERTGTGEVVEVLGRRGIPQPQTWRIVVFDPEVPGTLRSLSVDRERIVDDGAETRRYPDDLPGGRIDFGRVLVDSSDAFDLLNAAASRARVAFDEVRYALRGSHLLGKPVWYVDAVDRRGRPMGHVQVSASDGKMLRSVWYYWGDDSWAEPRIVDSALMGRAAVDLGASGGSRFGAPDLNERSYPPAATRPGLSKTPAEALRPPVAPVVEVSPADPDDGASERPSSPVAPSERPRPSAPVSPDDAIFPPNVPEDLRSRFGRDGRP